MLYKLLFLDELKKDFIKISGFYDLSQNKEKFINDFKLQVQYLEVCPNMFKRFYKNFRVIDLKLFPYNIHFTVKNDTVIVLRILHSNVWKHQL